MNSIDRAEKHRLLDEFLDKEAASERLFNSFETYAAAREAAYQARQALEAALGDGLIAERLANAFDAHNQFEPGSAWGSVAAAAYREITWTLEELKYSPNAKDISCGQRRMLARFLLDNEHRLPPNFATAFAASLFMANLGELSPLFEPYSIQGLPKNRRKHVAEFFLVARIYYFAGYRGHTIDQVLHAESDKLGGLTKDVINKIIQRLVIQSVAVAQRKAGEADRLAGKPERSELAGNYDLDALIGLRKAGKWTI